MMSLTRGYEGGRASSASMSASVTGLRRNVAHACSASPAPQEPITQMGHGSTTTDQGPWSATDSGRNIEGNGGIEMIRHLLLLLVSLTAMVAMACAAPPPQLVPPIVVHVDASSPCDDTTSVGPDHCVFWRTSEGKVFYGPFSMVRL